MMSLHSTPAVKMKWIMYRLLKKKIKIHTGMHPPGVAMASDKGTCGGMGQKDHTK